MGRRKSLVALLLLCLVTSQSPLIAQASLPKTSTELMMDWTNYIADTGRIADIDSSLKVDHYSLSQRRQLMNRLHQVDQRYRDSVMNGPKSKEKQDYFWRKIKANDKANQALLSKVIARYGWPRLKQYGGLGSSAAWLIVWHADRQYQRRYYPLIKQAYQQGTIKESHLELSKRLGY